MLNEADIIAGLQNAFPMIGDDAAVLPLSETESYVISKDILVENRHFRLSTTGPASLARKSLHVNLSDITAMGATPLFVMMGIALPSHLDKDWIEKFLAGFTSACQQANVQLIGGDTTGSDSDLFISITVIGRGETKNLKFRNGAKAGDVICVAGALGEAHAGLMALEQNAPELEAVKAKSLRPLARVEEGVWLGQQKAVTSMMDVSDGLYIDLRRLTEASGVGATIAMENLSPPAALMTACVTLRLDERECMLAGGEDYALLFTVSAEAYETLAKEFESQFGYPLMRVGTITSGKGIDLREKGQSVPFAYTPFSHFGEF